MCPVLEEKISNILVIIGFPGTGRDRRNEAGCKSDSRSSSEIIYNMHTNRYKFGTKVNS